jgi:hypothetical protein
VPAARPEQAGITEEIPPTAALTQAMKRTEPRFAPSRKASVTRKPIESPPAEEGAAGGSDDPAEEAGDGPELTALGRKVFDWLAQFRYGTASQIGLAIGAQANAVAIAVGRQRDVFTKGADGVIRLIA